MRRLGRLLALIGVIATAIWLLRDRLISLTAAREPEPPQFKPAMPHAPAPKSATDPAKPAPVPSPSDAAAGDDLKRVKGIGPVYEKALHSCGITTLAELTSADADAVAASLDVAVSRVTDWIGQARLLAS